MPRTTHPDASAVRTLIEPSSVAVIGASRDPTRLGGRCLALLKRGGFPGPIYPINPKRREIQGLKAYESVRDLPEAPDLAIVAVPVQAIHDAIEACGERGVRAAILFTAGFAETGTDGVAHQQALVEQARRWGLRILGPNCLGAVNVHRRLYATFSTSLDGGDPKPGGVGFVTQSGAFGSHCLALARKRGVGISCLFTTGNEAVIDTADCLAYLAEDGNTRLIALHLEGCRDGDKLKAALTLAQRAGKPVIAMKGGTSELGAAAALSHTASLSGADEAWDALFRRYPVYRAESIAEFIDVIYAANLCTLPKDNRLGIITVSGGVGVFMADAATHVDLRVDPLPANTQAKLKAIWPPAAARNPVDATAQAVSDPQIMARFLEIMLDEGHYDILINFLSIVALAPAVIKRLRPMLQTIRGRYPDRVLMLSALCTPEVRQQFEDDGFIVFEDPTAAIRAAAALASLGQRMGIEPRRLANTGDPGGVAPKAALPHAPPDEHDALQILAAHGVPVVPTLRAKTPTEAVAAATEIGFPVVLKIASADISHKSDIGGVHLSLPDALAVEQAYAAATSAVREHCPDANVDGVIVAPMRAAEVEMALGVSRDPTLGPMVMAGIGGVFIEVMHDVAFELAPIGTPEALAMLQRLRGYPLLQGARGRPAADIAAIADALVALSHFAVAHADELESVDINPLLVFAEGKGVAAADAVIIPRHRK